VKAAFIDRDGTLIEDCHYLSSPEGIRFKRGTIEGLRILRSFGFKIFVVTNQSGVARGYLSLERVKEVNRMIILRLEAEGIYIKGIYFCPHHPREDCTCRKPKPRLAKRILKEFPEIDLNSSVTIGDKDSDILFGKILGTKTILVSGKKSYGMQREADFVARDLKEAASWIVSGK